MNLVTGKNLLSIATRTDGQLWAQCHLTAVMLNPQSSPTNFGMSAVHKALEINEIVLAIVQFTGDDRRTLMNMALVRQRFSPFAVEILWKTYGGLEDWLLMLPNKLYARESNSKRLVSLH